MKLVGYHYSFSDGILTVCIYSCCRPALNNASCHKKSYPSTNLEESALLFSSCIQPVHNAHAHKNRSPLLQAHKVNLIHIESRPSKKSKQEYEFFVDCDNTRGGVRDAIHDLKQQKLQVTLLSRKRQRDSGSGEHVHGARENGD